MLSALAWALCPADAARASGSLTIVHNRTGAFVDISTIGEATGLHNEDEIEIAVPFGNAYFPAGTVCIGNNGGLGFSPAECELSNAPEELPSNGVFGGASIALLPYWSDIGNHEGDVYYHIIGEEPNRVFVVQWNGKHFADDQEGPTVTFQVQVFEAPGPQGPYAQFLYSDIENGLAAGGANALIGTVYLDPAAANEVSPITWALACPLAVRNGSVLSIVDVGSVSPCPADFNGDGFVSGDDLDAFLDAFDIGGCRADINNDTFVNGDDYDAFLAYFEEGCA